MKSLAPDILASFLAWGMRTRARPPSQGALWDPHGMHRERARLGPGPLARRVSGTGLPFNDLKRRRRLCRVRSGSVRSGSVRSGSVSPARLIQITAYPRFLEGDAPRSRLISHRVHVVALLGPPEALGSVRTTRPRDQIRVTCCVRVHLISTRSVSSEHVGSATGWLTETIV